MILEKRKKKQKKNNENAFDNMFYVKINMLKCFRIYAK